MTGSTSTPVLRLTSLRSGSTLVLRVAGELDLATAGQLDAALDDLLDHGRPQPERFIVDAEQLTFMDAAGLAPLLTAADRLTPGAMRMRNVRPPVLRVILLLDLTDTFGVEV